jgi:hypothetical protein
VAGWFTSSSAALDCFPNPTAVTVIVYFAGGICVSEYSPLAFEVVLSICPVALSSNVTVAPDTTAPVGSVTIPRRDVVAFWAKVAVVEIDRNKNRAALQKCLVTASSRK